ncbi:cytochrome P450 [Aaosphaeria arxii CBS 175.79]|uniref:Cytochrome P450 n=1 Tax=Aaosphaeria arxii CBS 175.79 TaxID=1450172 RepID=A0A6A5X7M3_9PLEO|nr:cytochrome P450 [Aaosphaeria arxii CBS 175.79]KAF2008784.1 cytochrome P450 [Aaosphaeria arxii CBS 175.79]
MSFLYQLSDETQFVLWRLLIFFGASIAFYWLGPFLNGLLFASTRRIPGPFWARVSRFTELRWVLKGDSNMQYIRLHSKYGPVVRVGPNRYSFSNPADIKIIYELGGKFTKTEFYKPLLAEEPDKQNIFALMDAKVHKERRRKIANLYSMSIMISYEVAVDRMTEVCMRKLSEFASKKGQISMPQFMQYYAFDVIGEITFNKSFNMMEAEGDKTGMIKGIHGANSYMAHIGLVPDLHPWIQRLQSIMGNQQGTNALLKFTFDQMEVHKGGNNSAGREGTADSFLAKLLRMKADNRVQMPHILDTCGSNIGAGSDTTAISLSVALFYLYTNPETLAKLRKEVDTMASESLISDPVKFQEAQSMPYLQAVIKETLRMHPAVGTILPRKVPKGGLQLAGTYFPAGTNVGVNAWVLHYSKEIYGEDADIFRPERWLEPKYDGDLRDQMMFAFGGGSRACIGKNISLLEMTKVLPQIVRNFDFDVQGGSKLKTYCAWFVYVDYMVTVKPRASS